METTETCSRCGEIRDRDQIRKCPICFKLACDDCITSVSGRAFCSQACAEFFFHGEEDDVDE